jgi:hypothetical protein
MKLPLLCRFDYHIWRVTHVAHIWLQDDGAHAAPMYEVVEKCRKCPNTRTSYEKKVPKKFKT